MNPSEDKKRKINDRDSILFVRFGLKALFMMIIFIIRLGPLKIIRNSRRYPWVLDLMMSMKMFLRLLKGRNGRYLEAILVIADAVTEGLLELMEGVFNHPDKLVIHQVSFPPEILLGMGLRTWMDGSIPWAGTVLSPELTEKYIDIAENEGMPPDICSASKSTVGFVMEDHLPSAAAIVSSTTPCDGIATQYTVIENKVQIPTFIADVPYNFYSDEAVDYFVGELKRMIAWLEEQTPGRMDWDRLREVCETRNRTMELEQELWDMLRHKPAPMAAEAIWMSSFYFHILLPGFPIVERMFERIVDLCKANLRNGTPAISNERYRTLLWNPPMISFSDIFVWAEQRYGVSLLMNMLTFHRHPFIDTKTPDSMLRGLAQICMQSLMSRHTRGPYENYMSDLFYLYENLDLDMIWVASSMGCKNSKGLLGILREKCREKNIPLLAIEYEIMDSRIAPKEDIMRQVDDFMMNVMKAERFDQ